MPHPFAKMPSVIQLPKGVKLTGIPFRVVDREESGAPKTLEVMPEGTDLEKADWVLFGDNDQFRNKNRT